jgi:protein TonB
MRAAGLEGTVPLEAVIGKDGTVVSVRLTSAQVHPEFAKAAIAAVEQWTFSPTLLNGVPTEVTMTTSVQFSLVD